MESIKEQAEIALCIGLIKIVDHLYKKPGRIKGLSKRLRKKLKKEIDKFSLPTTDEIKLIKEKVDRFESLMDFDTRKRHLLSYISAMMAILSERDCPKVKEDLLKMSDYFERINAAPTACFVSGSLAKDKWDMVWDDKI